MNIYATTQALRAWNGLPETARARTLAATYFAPAKHFPDREGEDSGYKKKGVDAIAAAACEKGFCKQWDGFARSFPEAQTRHVTATLQSRLLLNLSGSILENAGLAMEHVCGVPVIPGSAVKGAARRYAIALLAQTGDSAQKESLLRRIIDIFGCIEDDFVKREEKEGDLWQAAPDEAARLQGEYGSRVGKVCFLQAVPAEAPALCADVLTPHHMKYMANPKQQPADDEEPVPSFFPAVDCKPNTVYGFTLYSPAHPELLDTAEEWLTQAVTLMGLGAKGAAGYGYFSVMDKALEQFSQEQRDAIAFIANKKKVDEIFKEFHKQAEKKELQCWALLRAVCLDAADPACRKRDYADFMHRQPTEKKEAKAWEKAKEAVRLLAEKYNLNLPEV